MVSIGKKIETIKTGKRKPERFGFVSFKKGKRKGQARTVKRKGKRVFQRLGFIEAGRPGRIDDKVVEVTFFAVKKDKVKQVT